MTDGPLFVPSGDRAADDRYRLALERVARGDLAGAAEILVHAVELAPTFATAWFALGAIRDNLQDREGAIAAWQRARDLDPEDYHGARLQLARLGAGDGTPALLLAAVREEAPLPLRIGSMLDLGCGTGLGGAAFRPHVDWLVGVDVSPGMVAKARAKGLYDRLVAAELQQHLGAEAAASAHFHLVLAADVFGYVADLAPVADAVARVLAPSGLFAFTVETHAGGGVVLQPTLRYAHGGAHVRAALAGAGLAPLRLRPASTRTEQGAPVAGLVVVASTGRPGK